MNMALMPGADQKPKEDREIPKEDMYSARCYSIIDLGTHDRVVDKKTGETKPRREIYIAWELNSFMQLGENKDKPFVTGKKYTYSLFDQARLFKDLSAWKPEGFDPKNVKTFDLAVLLNQYATISIAHEPSPSDVNIVYANMTALTPYNPKAGDKLDPVNENIYFETTEKDIDKLIRDWQKLYKWQQKIVKESAEWDVLQMVLDGKDIKPNF